MPAPSRRLVPRVGGATSGIVLVLLVLLGLTACAGGSASGQPPTATTAAASAPVPTSPTTVAEVRALLAHRAAAVLDRSASALAATQVAHPSAGMAALGVRTAALPLTGWTYDVTAITSARATVSVQAVLHYRLGAEPVDATATRLITLQDDGPGWLVDDDRPVGASLPWDLGPTTWVAGPDGGVVVVGSAVPVVGSPPVTAAGLAADAARAAAAVTRVWGNGWRRDPVVVAVTGRSALASLSGRDTADTTGLVAVTTTDRVYVDVASYARLGVDGRAVLLAHEVTHLATGAATDQHVPQWLKEGFADYAGFDGSPLAPGAAAAVVDDVRAGIVPAGLPADADFAAAGHRQDVAYAGAWVMCRLLAREYGPAGLVAVYRATSASGADPSAAVDAALRQVTGQGVAAWTSRWQAELRRLAA